MGTRLFGFIRQLENKKNNLFLLVGRNQEPEVLFSIYESNKFIKENFNINVITPENEWYPKPYGVTKQKKSIKGLKETSSSLKHVLNDIIRQDKIDPETTIISGFSAGAVIAFEIWMTSEIKTCISHSGCVLNVDAIIPNNTEKDCLLIHKRDDDIFTWEERYLPTRNSLVAMNYNVTAIESSFGGHSILAKDVDFVSAYLNLI